MESIKSVVDDAMNGNHQNEEDLNEIGDPNVDKKALKEIQLLKGGQAGSFTRESGDPPQIALNFNAMVPRASSSTKFNDLPDEEDEEDKMEVLKAVSIVGSTYGIDPKLFEKYMENRIAGVDQTVGLIGLLSNKIMEQTAIKKMEEASNLLINIERKMESDIQRNNELIQAVFDQVTVIGKNTVKTESVVMESGTNNLVLAKVGSGIGKILKLFYYQSNDGQYKKFGADTVRSLDKQPMKLTRICENFGQSAGTITDLVRAFKSVDS